MWISWKYLGSDKTMERIIGWSRIFSHRHVMKDLLRIGRILLQQLATEGYVLLVVFDVHKPATNTSGGWIFLPINGMDTMHCWVHLVNCSVFDVKVKLFVCTSNAPGITVCHIPFQVRFDIAMRINLAKKSLRSALVYWNPSLRRNEARKQWLCTMLEGPKVFHLENTILIGV